MKLSSLRPQVLYAVLCGAKRALHNVGDTVKSPHGATSGYDPSHRTQGRDVPYNLKENNFALKLFWENSEITFDR